MKKRKVNLLIGVGTAALVVGGALAYWLLDGNAGKTLGAIFIILGLFCAIYLMIDSIYSEENQGGGPTSGDIGGRGMWG